MTQDRDRPVQVHRFDASGMRPRTDRVVVEEPLSIRACAPGEEPLELATTLRTPGHDEDLALGWLIGEGLAGPRDVTAIRSGDVLEVREPDDVVTVHLSRPLDPTLLVHRHGAATASCGLCGRSMIRGLLERITPLDDPGRMPALATRHEVAWDTLARLPDRLLAHQQTFGATGGVHATGIFTLQGELVVLREDVGRHNALDAAIGALARHGPWPPDGLVVLLSGRIGVELAAKAAAAGLAILAGVGAPTDLAVRTAEALGVTLIGFLRDGAGNVYTHASRIRDHDPSDRSA